MYLPAVFTESDRDAIASFIDNHPLATLALVDGDGAHLDHIPFMRVDHPGAGARLIGHVARGNRTWQLADGAAGVSAVLAFTGASAYVSPSFYPSKARTHEVVPTWNYVAVHLRGTLRTVHDEAGKHDIVSALTDRMESTRTAPWKVTDAPAPYIAKMLAGLVGLSFEVQSVTAKTKASQNRLPEDRRGVVEGLAADEGTREAAELVARLLRD